MLNERVMFSDEPEAIVIERLPGSTSRVLLRSDVREEDSQDGEGAAWVASEAIMVCATEDCPTEAEIMEDFPGWFEYVAAWSAPRQKSARQMQADIDYIAAMCGIDLEV